MPCRLQACNTHSVCVQCSIVLYSMFTVWISTISNPERHVAPERNVFEKKEVIFVIKSWTYRDLLEVKSLPQSGQTSRSMLAWTSLQWNITGVNKTTISRRKEYIVLIFALNCCYQGGIGLTCCGPLSWPEQHRNYRACRSRHQNCPE